MFSSSSRLSSYEVFPTASVMAPASLHHVPHTPCPCLHDVRMHGACMNSANMAQISPGAGFETQLRFRFLLSVISDIQSLRSHIVIITGSHYTLNQKKQQDRRAENLSLKSALKNAYRREEKWSLPHHRALALSQSRKNGQHVPGSSKMSSGTGPCCLWRCPESPT